LTVSIRQATLADIDALASLLAEIDVFHQPFDKLQFRQGPPQSANREQLTAGLIDETMRVLVCELDGRVVVYARMEFKNSKGNRNFRPMRLGIVHEVVVAESSRGLGIGIALMEALHDEASGAGVERIQLEHYSANGSASKLYEKLGYSVMRVVCVKDFQNPSEDP
jgi:ribosomal protein S18 acetylase RimI-like enzyme